MLGIRSADSLQSGYIGLVRAGVHVTRTVKDFADLDAAREQFLAGGVVVRDDQIKAAG